MWQGAALAKSEPPAYKSPAPTLLRLDREANMSVIYVVLPLSLLIAGTAVGAWVWAVRSGQLDDTETPALRMLDDDEDLPEDE